MSKGDASAAAEEVQGDQTGGCCWSLGGGRGWFQEVAGAVLGPGARRPPAVCLGGDWADGDTTGWCETC